MAPASTPRLLRTHGTESPEGLMWAHDKKHFFDFRGHIVSRSMIKKAGHSSLGLDARFCDKKIIDSPEPSPEKILTSGERKRQSENGITMVSRTWSSEDDTAVNTPADEMDVVWGMKQSLKLEESIALEDLPDFLVVNDFDSHLSMLGDRPSFETRYRLVTPKKRTTKSYGPTTGHLSLRDTELHSSKDCRVFQASIHLPGYSDSLLVDVKVASGKDLKTAIPKLEKEASMYASEIPAYFSEDWTGFQYMPEFEYDHEDGRLPVSAVVPKFYGYYVPEGKVESVVLSPILLFEDCGVPIDVEKLSVDDRATIYSFAHRLHRKGILHGEFEAHNILMQPGPLSVHPFQRSMTQPSFRLANFWNAACRRNVKTKIWENVCYHEIGDAKEVVYGAFGLKFQPTKESGYEVIVRKYWKHHQGMYRYVEIN